MTLRLAAAASLLVALASLSLQGCETSSENAEFLEKVDAPTATAVTSTAAGSTTSAATPSATTLPATSSATTLPATTLPATSSATTLPATTLPATSSATTLPASTSATPAVDSPVQRHGRLEIQGNVVVDESGAPAHLRGMSLFWSNWKPQFWTKETIQWLRDDWQISLLRAPMGIPDLAGQGGYLEEPAVEKQRMMTIVDAAIDAGIYVVIDWHDHHAHQHVEAAKTFFAEMAQLYGKYPNVLFETFNEPVPGLDWQTDIKPYHEAVLPIIRAHSENIVIVGTPEWSQWVEVAAADPLSASNVAYALHFYAGAAEHGEPLRLKVRQALDMGVALFATEWGTCHYTGKGALDLVATQTWLDFMAKHHISDANWAVSDKDEACSILKPSTQKISGWTVDDLTESGKFMRASLIDASFTE